MDWCSDARYRAMKEAAPCWPCGHYQRRVAGFGGHEHRCEIKRQGFPTVGRYCPAYLHESGSDPAEAYT